MTTFTIVMFWSCIINILMRLVSMGLYDWPKKTKTSLGVYTADTLILMAIAIWAGLALWVL